VRTQDLSQNRRIARLTQLTRELEQSRTPEDTLRILERGFAEVDGFVASLLLSTRGLSPGHYRVVDAHLKDQPLSDLHSPAKQEPGPVLCGGISALDGVGSYPLGIDESETFQEASVQLEGGDTLLLYTDGITEAQGTEGNLFGIDWLTRIFRDGGNCPAELIDRLRAAVRAHEHGEADGDDRTLVAARVL